MSESRAECLHIVGKRPGAGALTPELGLASDRVSVELGKREIIVEEEKACRS